MDKIHLDSFNTAHQTIQELIKICKFIIKILRIIQEINTINIMTLSRTSMINKNKLKPIKIQIK